MSTANASDQPRRPFNPNLGLAFILADQLIPLFQTGATDVPLARRMAMGALEAYAPESRADYVNAARTIAFSIAALALLGHATPDSVPMTEKMRAYSRANALNRSADQSERTMMQRRRYQNAHPGAEQPNHSTPEPATDDGSTDDKAMNDAALDAAIAEALAIGRPPRPPARAEAIPTRVASKATTPQTTVGPMSVPRPAAVSAIRASAPTADIGRSRLKDQLLRHVAMQPAATAQSSVRRPA